MLFVLSLLFLSFAFCDPIVSSFDYCKGELYKGTYTSNGPSGRLIDDCVEDEQITSRRRSAYFTYNDAIWVWGGWGVDSTADEDEYAQGKIHVLGDIWLYDLSDEFWCWVFGDKEDHYFEYHEAIYYTDGEYGNWFQSRPGGTEAFAFAEGMEDHGEPTILIFGGYGNFDLKEWAAGRLSDVWQLSFYHLFQKDASGAPWRHLRGPTLSAGEESQRINNVGGTTLKEFNETNLPQSRLGCSGWSTQDGALFWVFGGVFSVETEVTNELWVFDADDNSPNFRNWRFVTGETEGSDSGEYIKEFSASASPPSRSFPIVWKVDNGTDTRVFMYGGKTAIPFCYYADLWEFDINSEYWRFVTGSELIQGQPVYNSKGVYIEKDSITEGYRNFPGAIGEAMSWSEVDQNGDPILLFFGGAGPDSSGFVGAKNDIWSYSVGLDRWMWVEGSSLANEGGVISGDSIYPSGHYGSGFVRVGDVFHIFNGVSYTDLDFCSGGDSSRTVSYVSDHWTFQFSDTCNGSYVFQPHVCSGRGVCSNNTCTCNTYYEGEDCSIRKRRCDGVLYEEEAVCNHGKGECVAEDQCSCSTDGYGGRYCHVYVSADGTISSSGDIVIVYQMDEETAVQYGALNSSFSCADVIVSTDLPKVGINPNCTFEKNANASTGVYVDLLIINPGEQSSVSAGSDLSLLFIDSIHYPMDNESISVYFKKTSSDDGFAEFMEKFIRVVLYLIPLYVCICCCCTILLCICCCGICIWIYLLMRQRKDLRKFKDIKNLDQMLIDQDHMVSTGFKSLKRSHNLFNIKFKDLEIVRAIAAGGSKAVVYEVIYKKKKVALKLFKTKDLSSQESYDAFEKEVRIMLAIDHPNVLDYYGSTLDEPRVGVVIEFCDNGDLRKYMSNEDHDRFSTGEKLKIIRGIADAMSFLHEKGIVHRDLKCENILLTDQLVPKLIDFGISKAIEESSSAMYMTRQAGTSQYMAPEVTLSSTYGSKCDVFSFAIMLFEIVTEDFEPYGRFVDFNIELKVALNPDFRPAIGEKPIAREEGIEWLIEKVMKAGWSLDADDRPGFDEIVQMIDERYDETVELMRPYDARILEEDRKRKEIAERLKRKEIDSTND